MTGPCDTLLELLNPAMKYGVRKSQKKKKKFQSHNSENDILDYFISVQTIEQYKNLAYKWITDNRSPEVKACWALNGIVNKTLQKTTAALDCLKGSHISLEKKICRWFP
jgi:hypothetical protein